MALSKSSKQIMIVGLGTGTLDQLTLKAYRTLQAADVIYTRTQDHPIIEELRNEGFHVQAFDFIYEQQDQFADVYADIVQQLLQVSAQRPIPIIYAVPGHPFVAERTVQLLYEQADIQVKVISGESFIDQAFTQFRFDPVEGFQLLDAHGLNRSTIRPQLHTVITQVYDSFTASEVKLSLMDVYPDDYVVQVGHHLGIADEQQLLNVPLYELDRLDGYSNRTMIYIARDEEPKLQQYTLERLQQVVEILRSPCGCPWDREQTHQSLRRHWLEETYEAIDAIDADDVDNMQEEFGDVLLQVLLHSQIEAEQGTFTIYDVVATLHNKLISRHPHVFGDHSVKNAEEALESWAAVKAAEKSAKGELSEAHSVLDGIPKSASETMKAFELQRKAAKVGFDWAELEPVIAKVREELDELQAELASGHEANRIDEYGDLLFALINVARHIGTDPEAALARANRKFRSRFAHIEQQSVRQGLKLSDLTLAEMDILWDEAKQIEREQKE